jgi:hypothetical protein
VTWFFLRTGLARKITLYRPERLMRLRWQEAPLFRIQGKDIGAKGWYPEYEVGDLRASVFGVRLPILWALDCLIFAGVLTPPKQRA